MLGAVRRGKTPIAQVRVLHRTVRGKRRWYVQLVLEGRPSLKEHLERAPRVVGQVGVDVGSRHIAAVGPTSALLADLAPTMLRREAMRDELVIDARDGDVVKRDRWYRRLQRAVSRTRDRNNASAVKRQAKTLKRTRDGKANGKVIEVPSGYRKGSRIVTSGRVAAMQVRLAEVARADEAARTNDHGRLANAVLRMGDVVALEKLSYVGWQRSFGRQVRRFAPGGFQAHLEARAPLFDVDVVDISTRDTRLSQVCHGCGTLLLTPIRGPIAKRMKPACEVCGREEVHRDLYSAFLACYARETVVDLPGAQAAWAGMLECLSRARRQYESSRGQARNAPNPVVREDDVRSVLHASPAQAGSYQRLVSAPATVRDEVHGDDTLEVIERLGGNTVTQDRSTSEAEAFPPRRPVRPGSAAPTNATRSKRGRRTTEIAAVGDTVVATPTRASRR